MHTNIPPVIHRDLKSLNILIACKEGDPVNNSILKISDFGISKSFETTTQTGFIGTYQWMAPEVIMGEKYSIKADIYSFGIIMWEILTRQTLYDNLQPFQVTY